MPSLPSVRTLLARGPVALAVAALTAVSPAAAAPGDGDGREGTGAGPTVVLVHGAMSDASAWRGVIERLQRLGHRVVAPANPLRGLSGDSAYLASVLERIEGPIVLVGHSYAGAVIGNAAASDPDVEALVYIAAHVPDRGESVEELNGRFPGSRLGTAVVPARYPLPGGGTAVEFSVAPDRFREVLVGGAPARTTAVMAAGQRPIAQAALAEESRAAAWRTVPSWYLVATEDRAVPPRLERFMADRAGSRTVEVDAPHFAMITHPEAVARLILDASAGRAPADGRDAAAAGALAETGPGGRAPVTAGVGALALAAGTALLPAARRLRPRALRDRAFRDRTRR
ncbi:alpha/beta fold hydrolase [Streptomyces thermolineatus]|uniref:alpha/beta fold hydrolase n=1 Tax=Streptomyces thermolineatus TaxID=44033 RepID=UPI00384EBAE6